MAYLKDISAVLGLSVSTVSRALKGYPDISEETRRKVMETAEDLDYKYDSGRAPKPTAKVWGTLGILAPGYAGLIKTRFYRELFCGMAEETAGSQRDLVIMGEDALGKEMSWVARAEARRVDGICLLASRSDIYKGRFADLLESKIPVVSVGNDLPGRISICRDLRGDAITILKYLKAKGHCNTAYLGDLSLDSRKYASMLGEEAKKLNMGFIEIDSGSSVEYGCLTDAKQSGATCVLFSSHREACSRIREWEKRGVCIPDDISVSVVGTDYEENRTDHITCIECSPVNMGREAIRRLIRIMEHPEADTGERVTVCGRVYEGNTVRDFGGNTTRNILVN